MAQYTLSEGQSNSFMAIGSGDTLTILNGGLADKPTVSQGGRIMISAGGSALMPMVEGGTVDVYADGSAKLASVSAGGTVTLYTGANVGSAAIHSGGSIVCAGGVVYSAGVTNSRSTLEMIAGLGRYNSVGVPAGAPQSNWRARFVVYGGSALETEVYSGGTMVVSGGLANFTRVSKGGLLSATGGTVYNTSVFGGRVIAVQCTVSGLHIRDLDEQEGVVNVANAAVLKDVVVNTGGRLRVNTNGSASNVRVDFGGAMEITGQATGIMICRQGIVTVSGTATDILHGGVDGTLNVARGAVVSGFSTHVDTNMIFVGSMDMRGKMYDAILYHSGDFNVQSGGTTVSAVLTRDGTLNISNGGTALDTRLTQAVTGSSAGAGDAALNIFAGGVAENTVMNDGAFHVYVSSGGTAVNTLVKSGRLFVYSGGTALDTTVQNGCYMSVYDGGYASGGRIAGGYLYVASSGSIANMEAAGWGKIIGEISLGGRAEHLSVDYNGFVQVGGTVVGATVSRGGHLYVMDGSVSDVTVSSGGYLRISAGGTCVGNTAQFGAKVYVSKGGMMSSPIVSSGASLTVESGGTATAVSASSGAHLKFDVAPGTYVQGTSGGSAFELKDSVITGFTVDPGDALHVKAGCSALDVRENGGYVDTEYGAVATFVSHRFDGLVLAGYQSATVHSGTTAVAPEVYSGGSLCVFSGGSAPGIKEAGGYVKIESGAIVTFAANSFSDLLVVEGDATVHSGTTAVRTSAGKNGRLFVYSGGTATDTVIDAGGSMLISGGTACGLDIAAGGQAIAYAGAEVNFDLTGRTAADPAPVNDYTRILGTPEYTITVLDQQEVGEYKLAEKAVGFNQTVTVRIAEGPDAGISVGNTITLGSRVYSLNLTDQSLSLTVSPDTTPPVAPTVTADITGLTNQDVTVTATFSEDSAKKEYSIDNQTWSDYTAGIKFTQNGTAYFRGTDAAGNVSEVTSYAVTNIDKVPPVKPTASADITAPTNQNVTVTATFSEDSTVREYSLYNTPWTNYTGGVVFSENGTAYFRGTDAAGNVSEVASYAVTNIDKVPPVKPTASASTTAPTNQTVTVTAAFSEDSTVREYSLDNSTWQAYTAGIVFSENGTAYFRGTDAAGNVSEVTSYAVTNIDKVPPAKPTASASTTAPTNQNVTVTATFSEDSTVREYSLDNSTWQAYTAGVVMSTNGTAYFRGTDAAGNVSEVTSYAVTNIDKVPPAKPTASASTTAPTNQDVTVTAAFSEDSAKKEYSIDNQTWSDYTAGIKFTQNGTAYFRGTDAAGNVSEVASYAVTNIDKVPPAKPTASASTTAPTNQNVTVTATFSEDSTVREYSLDNSTWQAYTAGVVMSTNGTAYFRGKDAAGNVSEVASYAVTNIDKVPPAKPTASASTTAPTNQDVTVTATFSEDSAKKEYSIDNQTWSDYTAGIKFTQNGTAYFRGKDAAGNVSEVTSYAVTNIDKVPPVKPTASADITTPTSQNVTVTAAFSADSTVKEYSLDGETWQAYTAGIVFPANGTAYFRGKDAAGNVSEVTSYAVTNIVAAPETPDAGDLNADGRADVVMTIAQVGHGAYGATGAWLIQADQTPAWGDLSTRNEGWEIFGTGRTAAGKASADVYVRSTGNVIGAWTTGPDGNVTGWETVGEFDAQTRIVGLGDFNGNGQTDLLLRNANGAVGCFFTNGEGWNYFQSLGDEWKLSAIGDLNGDGRDDVVLKHDAGFAGSWLTQADGTMAWADLDTLPEGFAIVGSGDFNGDGTDDVLLQKDSYFGAWLVQNGNAAGWMGLGDLPNVTVEQIADFDGDGKDDLRVRTTAGDLGSQLVKGADTLEWKYYGSVGDEWSTALAAL